MNNKNALKKILEHPDKDEIISKLVMGFNAKDVHEWLANKYTNISETKFVVAEKSLKSFQDNYLDIYAMIKDDLAKTKVALAANSTDEDILLSVQNNHTYKGKMLELASQEIDIKKMLANMIVAVETRCGQIFDSIQENPRDVNSRTERILIELFDTLGSNLERYNKLVLGAPDQIIQHNVTVQHIDQYVQLMQEAIRLTLAEMDVDFSLRFMDILTEKLTKLRPPTDRELNTETRLAEAKVLTETIAKKLNEGGYE